MKTRIISVAAAIFLVFQICQAQNSTLPGCDEDKQIDDLYDLDEWQNSTRAFGQTVFGILSQNPDERQTIQELLYIAKKNSGNVPALELTVQLMKGYFGALPAYLDSPGSQGLASALLDSVEKDLTRAVTHHYDVCKQRNETCYYDLSLKNRSRFLMANINWETVIMTADIEYKRLIVGALLSRPYPQPNGTDDQCYIDTVQMLKSFYLQKLWAIEMFDAMGKLPIGLFQGNLNWIGQYDQCNLITANRTNMKTFQLEEVDAFHGSYCDIKMKLPESLGIPTAPGQTAYLRMGLCFPSTCGANDVKLIMSDLEILGRKLPEVESARCHSDSPSAKGEFASDRFAHAAAGLMGTIVLIVVLCTIVEGVFWYQSTDDMEPSDPPELKSNSYALSGVVNQTQGNGEIVVETKFLENGNGHANGKMPQHYVIADGGVSTNGGVFIKKKPAEIDIAKKLMQTYSLYSTVPALLSTKQPKGSLKSLDALRVFNMNWIVLGHVFSIGAVFMPETMSNTKLAADKIKDWTLMGVYTAMLAVDSFFLLSGLLVSYLFLKTCKKLKGDAYKWAMHMFVYYVHRFIRIIPLYATIILVYAAFGKYLGAGPMFDWEQKRIKDCNTNWWANLIFINNLYKPKEMCLGWSWYLANDMQFYWIAPLILIPLYMYAVSGLLIILVFFAGHWAITAWLWAQTEGNSYMQDPDIFYEAYITPYCRIGPYLVGILLGWIFYKGYKIRNMKICQGSKIIERTLVAVGWIISLFTMGVVVYVQFQDVKEFGVAGHSWNTLQRTAYETLSRDAWAVALAWIVYACNDGYAGFVGHILNWRGWGPLGKMTFAVYLIHPVVLFLYLGNRRDLNYFDNFSVAYTYAGYLLLSYVGGALLSLIFEWPAAGLEKILLSRLRRAKST